MSTLTFQAASGGAVNLLGPNISSTVNFTLPNADGTTGQTLITNGSGTLSFTNPGAYIQNQNTWTGTQSFVGTTVNLAATLVNAAETATVSATAATGTINFDVTTQSVLYYTTNASGNWTLNVRGNSSTSLNSLMSVGQALTIVFIATQGATAYYQNVFKIDGTTITPKWQNGSAPVNGNASGLDVYSVAIIKTASATYTVLESITRFA